MAMGMHNAPWRRPRTPSDLSEDERCARDLDESRPPSEARYSPPRDRSRSREREETEEQRQQRLQREDVLRIRMNETQQQERVRYYNMSNQGPYLEPYWQREVDARNSMSPPRHIVGMQDLIRRWEADERVMVRIRVLHHSRNEYVWFGPAHYG